jgi:hypothetical protein
MKKSVKKAVKSTLENKRADHSDPAVEAVFAAYPKPVKARLLALRRLILDIAKATEGVGALEEALKWGQPSYLTQLAQLGVGFHDSTRCCASRIKDLGSALG